MIYLILSFVIPFPYYNTCCVKDEKLNSEGYQLLTVQVVTIE